MARNNSLCWSDLHNKGMTAAPHHSDAHFRNQTPCLRIAGAQDGSKGDMGQLCCLHFKTGGGQRQREDLLSDLSAARLAAEILQMETGTHVCILYLLE